MRDYEEYQKILSLWDAGYKKLQIATMTGIPRGTVRDCIKKFATLEALENYQDDRIVLRGEAPLIIALKSGELSQEILTAYAYLFGLYLGDGTISKIGRVYSLRIFLDKKYPQIIESCQNAIQIILPNNRVGVTDMNTWAVVGCYYKYWQQVFPQHGAGKKHDRPIILDDWQQRIVDALPLEFFRGLYHSDGSKSRNVVKGKNYERYFFTNESEDIRKLYTATADKLGLQWTQTNRISIAISRREDVAWLDEHIGAKA